MTLVGDDEIEGMDWDVQLGCVLVEFLVVLGERLVVLGGRGLGDRGLGILVDGRERRQVGQVVEVGVLGDLVQLARRQRCRAERWSCT